MGERQQCSQDCTLLGRGEASGKLRLQADLDVGAQETNSQAAFESSALVFQNLLGKSPLSSLPISPPHLAPKDLACKSQL